MTAAFLPWHCQKNHCPHGYTNVASSAAPTRRPTTTNPLASSSSLGATTTSRATRTTSALFLSPPPLPSTFTIIADAADVSSSSTGAAILPSGQTFEAVAPDTTALVAFGWIALLSALAVWTWANQVVPVSRTNLALSKKNGPVRDYLDELRQAEMSEQQPQQQQEQQLKQQLLSNSTTATASSTEIQVDTQALANTNTTVEINGNTRALERWLFTDWLQKPAKNNKNSGGGGGRQKEPALPILKKAKWNSGDNPVLVASALIMGGVLLTAVTERVGSLLSF